MKIDRIDKVKMLGTTNPRFDYMCGHTEIAQFSDRNRIFWFGDFHTSYIVETKINENIMTIKTRNSEYTFELLDGITFDEFKRTTDEIKELEELCK